MNGSIDFHTAYQDRLQLLQPDQDLVDWLAELYQQQLTTGAIEIVQQLQKAGKQVHIVSGGILQALLLLAAPLGIPITHIHGVSLLFDSDGSYIGFDEASPLCRQHGKAELCRTLLGDGEHGVFIGDGITDLETTAAGIDFIGYGGVVRRNSVESGAHTYYPDTDLAGLLPWLLSPAEMQEL